MLTPEQKLVLLCARHKGPEPASVLSVLSGREEIDWNGFTSFAVRHGLVSIVYPHLYLRYPDFVPDEIIETLGRLHRANSVRVLHKIKELEAVLRCLEAHGIAAIPFKGPVMAAQVYGNPQARTSSDLDLVIRRRDVRVATSALCSLGYVPEFCIEGAQGAAYLRFYNELGFLKPDDHALVEIQWELVPWHYALDWDFGSLFEHFSTLTVEGKVFPSLPPEELLLALCIHGAKHRWEKLIWVCDVAWLIAGSRDLDWDRVLSVSSAAGGRRILLLGLQLAQNLFETALPDEVRRAMQAVPALNRLAEEAGKRLFKEKGPVSLFKKMLFFSRAMDRHGSRVQFVMRTLMNMFLVASKPVEIPRLMMPLYFMTRPLSVAARSIMPFFARGAGR